MAIEFPISIENSVATIKVAEELQSVESCLKLKEAIAKISEGTTSVVLDLSEVNSLSSYSLGKLMVTRKQLAEGKVQLKLKGAKPPIQLILSELRILDQFPIV